MASIGLIQHRLIIKRLFIVFFLYSFCRLVFFFHNVSLIKVLPVSDIVTAFLWGMRFDTSALLFLNLPLILLWLLPGAIQQNQKFQKITKVIFILANTAFFSATLVDADLIHFTNRRMTLSFWSLGGDWLQQIPQLFTYYWKLTLSGVACLVTLIKTYEPWEEYHKHFHAGFFKGLVWNFVFVCLIVIGARGGLQYKPLIPGHANLYSAPILNHMVLNTTFAFLMSLKKERVDAKAWFPTNAQALQLIQRTQEGNLPRTDLKKNIIIIVLESFALEYMGKANDGEGYTPFLDELTERSVYFPNFHANGRRSIEAMPSILCGLPSLLKEPFITSQFQTNKLNCLPQNLGEHGYHTSFFHGGDNGTMHFDSFAKKMGVQSYFGLDEYPHKGRDFDGSWGIFDEPFYMFMLGQLSSQKEPFMSLFFSLSSHQPYSVPEKYKGRFSKGTLEIHESVGYADYALRQFFRAAERESWYKNTLFVVTADHTQKSNNPKYANPRGPFQVPLLIFDPSEGLRPQIHPKISQHADISPTVLSYLGVESNHLFGGNLFSKKDNGVMVNRTGSGLVIGRQGRYQEFSFSELDLEEPKVKNDQEDFQFAKAYYQIYLNSLIHNKEPSQLQ